MLGEWREGVLRTCESMCMSAWTHVFEGCAWIQGDGMSGVGAGTFEVAFMRGKADPN